MSYWPSTITISDVTVTADVELYKSEVLAEFEASDLLKEVRDAWGDQEILGELDEDEVHQFVHGNDPEWADPDTFANMTKEELKRSGAPRRLMF